MKTPDDRQKKAIAISIETGRKIRGDMPGVADDYRRGSYLLQIVDDYGIARRYGVTRSIARSALSSALRGYDGSSPFSGVPYDGLIAPGELNALEEAHKNEARVSGGIRIRNEGKGIFGMDTEKKNAAVIAGMEKGFGQTRQMKPWSRKEIGYVERKFYLGACVRGDFYATRIASELNDIFHGGEKIRTALAVRSKLCRLRKK